MFSDEDISNHTRKMFRGTYNYGSIGVVNENGEPVEGHKAKLRRIGTEKFTLSEVVTQNDTRNRMRFERLTNAD